MYLRCRRLAPRAATERGHYSLPPRNGKAEKAEKEKVRRPNARSAMAGEAARAALVIGNRTSAR